MNYNLSELLPMKYHHNIINILLCIYIIYINMILNQRSNHKIILQFTEITCTIFQEKICLYLWLVEVHSSTVSLNCCLLAQNFAPCNSSDIQLLQFLILILIIIRVLIISLDISAITFCPYFQCPYTTSKAFTAFITP